MALSTVSSLSFYSCSSASSHKLKPDPFWDGLPIVKRVDLDDTSDTESIDVSVQVSTVINSGLFTRLKHELRRRSINAKFPHTDNTIPPGVDDAYDELLAFLKCVLTTIRDAYSC
jgi:hypothetical protein